MTLDGRLFRSVSNTENGTVDDRVLFSYTQTGNIVSATYEGGDVQFGQLIGTIDGNTLDARYQHVSITGELMTGVCITTVERLPDQRIRLHEQWRWTSGDRSTGTSIVEEVAKT